MSGHGPRKTLDQLNEALRALDARLTAPITLRAVGGYALMHHGLRGTDLGADALTTDIDTVTADFAPEIRAAIAAVAAELGLAGDWINNDVVGENPLGSDAAVEHLEHLVDATWLDAPLSEKLEYIELQVADLPTLTRLKLAAVDDAAYNGRTQDLPDLISLLDAQHISTVGELEARFGAALIDYPVAREVLHTALAAGGSDLAAALAVAGDEVAFARENAEVAMTDDEIDALLAEIGDELL